MEQHEGVYEQIIEVNNTNEGTEYISQELVQEIIVQNDNDQGSTVSREMTDIEIILSDNCVAVQDQSNSNITIACTTDEVAQEKLIDNVILQEEPKKDENLISQTNNVNDNVTDYAESHEKIEEFVIQTDAAYHQENAEVNNAVDITIISENTNKEIVSETIIDASESVPITNVSDFGPDLTENQPSDNHSVVNDSQNVVHNLNEVDDKTVKEPEQELENILCEKETESIVDTIQTENIESMEVDSASMVSEVVSENVAVEVTQSQSESQSVNTEEEKEVIVTECTKSDKMPSEEVPEVSEKVEYSVLVAETVADTVEEMETETMVDTKVVTNSDDVAVLTEFNSTEFTQIEIIQEDQVEEQEKNEKVIVESDTKETQESIEETSEKDKSIKEEDQNENSAKSVEDHIIIEQVEHEESIKNETSAIAEPINEEDEDELELHLSTQSNENHRKVIQDIFDDWQDENGDEENNQLSSMLKENHDSVEMELRNLLNDNGQDEDSTPIVNIEHTVNNFDNLNNAEQVAASTPSKPKVIKSEKVTAMNKSGTDIKIPNKSPKSTSSYIPAKDQSTGRSPRTPIVDQSDSKQKQSPRPGVKIPGMHLTSQIASTAEVNEVLKERLREKQRDLITPKTADIVFVKKITQRLSNQLSAAAATVPSLIPIQSKLLDSESDKNKSTEELSETNKSSTVTDNKELLAILEGDVDPDWSNLKPQSINEDSNRLVNSADSHNNSGSSKLDPQIERELALKQLLELPNIPSKKTNPGPPKRSKRTAKTTANKSSNDASESKSTKDTNDSKEEVINLESSTDNTPTKKAPKALKENNSQNAASLEIGIEESRSGRKRKLTEKAREHELSVKRQKVLKGRTGMDSRKSSQDSVESDKRKSDVSSPKPTETSKSDQEQDRPSTPKSNQTKSETKQSKTETRQSKTDKADAKASPKPEAKEQANDTKESGIKGKMTPVRRPKLGLVKKDAPISKRKLAVKNLLRQKMTGKKTVAAAKAKIQTSTPKPVSQTKSTPDKSSSSTPPTKTKKSVSEIDRLLQDEGVVNLLYDVEQPDSRKRLVPITKSQKKVMDVEKAERELKLRTKLVRNAVLRLRNSNATTVKISPRSRRNVSASGSAEQSPVQSEKKSNESSNTKSPKSSAPVSLPSDFIIPAKIRNAADASRIIRRHSSSSFSSASASPRVSIDLPPEAMKVEEPEVPAKTKRKLSQDTNEKVEVKKGRKKNAPKAETEEKETSEKSPVKKEPVKKFTRSNVAAAAAAAAMTASTSTKSVPRNKKVPKSKASSESSSDIKTPKGQDELSACLAEAASALLSGTSSSSRSSSASTGRKKGSTNVSKTQATDDEKVDIKKLFSNKEINVRQHGHLVQLILTPSTPVSGIRNAITIPVMNELREALSILKNDDDCRVVLFTSTGTSFCEGLDLSYLLHSSKDERKLRAEEMATTVKDFIRTLAAFNKPIVAGVQGAAIGIGVTMLPLFDLVIASDKATFSTPYGKLGQIAEGAAVLTLSHSLGSAVTNELLLGGRVLTASEALRAGLVTRVLWPDRFQVELLPSLKAMSEQSSQSMEATKALLRHSLRKKLDVALESESLLLIQHWCSSECQEAIKAYVEEKGQ